MCGRSHPTALSQMSASLARQRQRERAAETLQPQTDPPPRGDASIQGSFRNTDMTGTLKEVLFMYKI